MSLSLDSTSTEEVKVVKTDTTVPMDETKDLSLDSKTEEVVDFSELSEYIVLYPKEFLTSVEGRDSYTFKHKFEDTECKPFMLKTKSGFISDFVKKAFETEKTTKEIPVPNGSRHQLAMIVEYLIHQDGMVGKIPPKPITSKKMPEIVKDPWVAKFCDRFDELVIEGKKLTTPECRNFLYDTITLADYLHIECLIYILCAKVATYIKGTPQEDLKGILLGTGEKTPVVKKEVEKKEEKKE